MKKRLTAIYVVLLAMLGSLFAGSCNNSTSDTAEYYVTVSTTSTLVSSFRLGANTKVLANLDSIPFTIDQERGLIYNADSLPKGTDVSHLNVSVTFAQTVSTSRFHVTGGKVMKDSTFTYTSATQDSIDFTGDVVLTVVSNDQQHTRNYIVKVNVHTVEPDTLTWNRSLRRDLPGLTGTATAHRMVRQGADGNFYSLLVQGAETKLMTAAHPTEGVWSTVTTSLPFTPLVESFAASNDALYLLDTGHQLMRSTDGGASWTSCGVTWYSISGGYNDLVLGVEQDGDTFKHDIWPRPDGFSPTAIDDDFPISGSSPLMAASNTWSESQQAMMAGGVKQDGSYSSDVWGFDGHVWGRITIGTPSWKLPEVKGAVLIPYFTCDIDKKTYVATRFPTWILLGGTLADGKPNSVVYTSRDQGLRWSKGDTGLQLPAYMTAPTGAQAFVVNTTFSNKKSAPRRIARLDDEWQCPYIYLAGGYTTKGKLLTDIWVGVLTRLKFREIY